MFKAFVIFMVLGSPHPITYQDTRSLHPTEDACKKRYREMMNYLVENNKIIIRIRGRCKRLTGA